jgi:hypothetical protein
MERTLQTIIDNKVLRTTNFLQYFFHETDEKLFKSIMQDGEKRLKAYRIKTVNDVPSLKGSLNISIKKSDEENITKYIK